MLQPKTQTQTPTFEWRPAHVGFCGFLNSGGRETQVFEVYRHPVHGWTLNPFGLFYGVPSRHHSRAEAFAIAEGKLPAGTLIMPNVKGEA